MVCNESEWFRINFIVSTLCHCYCSTKYPTKIFNYEKLQDFDLEYILHNLVHKLNEFIGRENCLQIIMELIIITQICIIFKFVDCRYLERILFDIWWCRIFQNGSKLTKRVILGHLNHLNDLTGKQARK